MSYTIKKTPLFILGVFAIVFSRILFVFFNDPEGPNLLVVIAMAAFVYLVSLGAYLFSSSISDRKRFILAIFVQLLLIAGLYFFLK